MISTRALSVALFAVAALVPLAARAEPTEAQKREAKELNDKATRLYEVGKYGEAIEEYQKVYLLVDDPVLLYNIAQSYRLWGKPEDSIRFYRNYLRRAPGAPNRADVEKKIADQEKVIEERRRNPVTTPPTTTPPEVTAPPPPPPVQTTPPGFTPPPVEQPPLVTQPPGPEPTTSHRTRRVVSYVLLISGGALLATSVAAGAVANNKAKDLERMSKDGTRPAFDPAIEKAGKNANNVAVATGVLGAAAGITGGILLLTSGGTSSEKPVALFPMVGPQLAGGGARVAF
jgi:tetratricopeptide (TPR) repeat protein